MHVCMYVCLQPCMYVYVCASMHARKVSFMHARTQIRRPLGRRVRGLTVCQYLSLRLSLGGLGGHPPPGGVGGPVAAFRVVIYNTWALFGRCFFESILGFVRCKRWRARGVANFESQNATVQRFRPFAQTAHVHPAA